MPACSAAITGSPQVPDLLARAYQRLREQAPVRHVTVRKPGTTSTPQSRARPPGARGRSRVSSEPARHAPARARHRRRLPQPAGPGLKATADAERLAVARHRSGSAPRAARAVPRHRRDRPTSSDATWLAFLFALAPELQDADRRDAPRAGRTPGPRRAARGQGQTRRPPTARGSSAPARRRPRSRARRSGRRSAASAASSSASRSPASPAPLRFDLLTALGAAGRYPLEADAAALRRGRPRRRSPPSACSSPATGCCSSAARRTSPTRPTCRSRALDRGLAGVGHADRARRPDRGAGPGHRRRPRHRIDPWRCAPDRFGPGRFAHARAARAAAGDRPTRRRRRRARGSCCSLGCFALAALCLLLPWSPPTTRGRGSSGAARSRTCDLVTTTGPSWKPLPVIFTTPFSLAGDDGAPLLWLVVARAGGILAFAMAFRLGKRLAGPVAGLIAGGLADPRRRVHPQLLPRQLGGHPRRALPVGDRAPPRRPPPRRVPARASAPRCCAPRCGRSSRSTAST